MEHDQETVVGLSESVTVTAYGAPGMIIRDYANTLLFSITRLYCTLGNARGRESSSAIYQAVYLPGQTGLEFLFTSGYGISLSFAVPYMRHRHESTDKTTLDFCHILNHLIILTC